MAYTAHDGHKSGDQVYVTGEWHILTFKESDLVHPARDSGLVVVGDPVIAGNGIVGVAMTSATADTDLIAIDTRAVRWFNATLASGADLGDTIYIHKSTAVLSRTSTGFQFGRLLADASADGSPQLVPVAIESGAESEET